MEVMLIAAALATLAFVGHRLYVTATDITQHYEITFFTPGFYVGFLGAFVSVFSVALFMQNDAGNGLALCILGVAGILWGHRQNVLLIGNKQDALKLTAIQILAGALLAAFVIAKAMAQARR